MGEILYQTLTSLILVEKGRTLSHRFCNPKCPLELLVFNNWC
jgi:hypothetical protein